MSQLEEAPHIILQKYIHDNWPDDGSVDPRWSEIRWGQDYSGQGDVCLIVEGGTPNSGFVNTGWTLKVNRQRVNLKAHVRTYHPEYPQKIHNMRKWITDFIRVNHSSDYLAQTWGIDYVVVRTISTRKLPNTQRANVYQLRMSIDVIYMTQIS
jgi:hypothetical protein